MRSEDNLVIELIAAALPSEELKRDLQMHLGPLAMEVNFHEPPPLSEHRIVDPTVLVAVVGAASSALTALITGLLAIGKQRRVNRIILKCKDVSIDVPVDAPIEKVEQLIQMARGSRHCTLALVNFPWEADDS